MTFQKAVKRRQKLRIGLVGASGTGKTYTALAMAVALGERVAVIDTEHGSASLYADLFNFDVLELDTFSPDTYVQAINDAAAAGYDVVVVDSLSHAWMGKDGALEQVDKHAARERGNSFAAWRHVTPMHARLIDTLVGAPVHLIATMRSKTEYVLEEDSKGKKVPRKIGMAPVQRDGMEYEFTVVGDLDYEHRLVVTKSRCSALADAVIEKPGANVAHTLLAWLDGAAPELPRAQQDPPANGKQPASPAQVSLLSNLIASNVFSEEEKAGVMGLIARGISAQRASEVIERTKATLGERKAAEEQADAFATAGAQQPSPFDPAGADLPFA